MYMRKNIYMWLNLCDILTSYYSAGVMALQVCRVGECVYIM